MPRRKKQDQSRVFDVSKPNKFSPSATSRPVIAGHQMVGSDPMVKEEKTGLLNHDKPVLPITVSSSDDDTPDKLLSGISEAIKDTPPAEPPKKEPEPESPPVSKEASVQPDKADDTPDFGSGGNLFSEPAPQTPPAASAAESENSEPLSPVLASPKADDPVGLSGGTDPLSAEISPDIGKGDTLPAAEDDKKGEQSKADEKNTKKAEPEALPPVETGDMVLETLPVAESHGISHFTEKVPRRWILSAVMLLIVGTYFSIDAGLVGSGMKLPFELFKESSQPANNQPDIASAGALPPATTNTSPASGIPSGFTSYPVINTNITFAYPLAWGTADTVIEAGYSQRGQNIKPTGDYAYLISFSRNKDVTVAVTSAKYLPPKRTALYYDYLQWCIGSHDSKFYRQVLMYSTADGVETPSNAVCNAGPLSGVSRINESTIVELKSTDEGGQLLGDIYTRNLEDKDLPAIRVKDAAMKNGPSIQQMLDTVKFGADNS